MAKTGLEVYGLLSKLTLSPDPLDLCPTADRRGCNLANGSGVKRVESVRGCIIGVSLGQKKESKLMKQKIYYSIDEETGDITIDIHEMEQEAIEQLEKAYPGKKVTAAYAS